MTNASDERVRAEMMNAALVDFLRMEQSLRAAAEHLAAAEAIRETADEPVGVSQLQPFPRLSQHDA